MINPTIFVIRPHWIKIKSCNAYQGPVSKLSSRHVKEITHHADIDRHPCQGGIDTSASRTLASVSTWRSRFLRECFLPLRRFEVLLCSSCPRVHIPENKKVPYSRSSPLSREAFVPNSDPWKKKKRRIEMNIGKSNFF